MSKKYKIKKKVVSPVLEKPSDKSAAPKTSSKSVSGSVSLILFDRKTKIFLYTLLSLYFLISILKIHSSNISNWDIFFGAQKSESVIAGEPRFIRMDEWMIGSPGVLSQYELGMPVKNEALGAENTPVITGLPVKDISTILRPNLWPYFIFDNERAFAFSWNFNIFIFIISTFLLFMLLTRNNFWLSVFGSLFVFFSAAVQWWSYQVGAQMMYLNGMCIAFVYILYHKKLWPLILAGILLVLSVNSFLFNLYPPYQVPLVYLYLAILIGYLIQRKELNRIKEKLSLKIVVIAVSLLIIGVFLYHYYHLVKETYTVMLNTVYPGRRFSTGGNLIDGKLFADFFGMYMIDTHYPNQWQNICEISGFMMFFPIVFYALGYFFFKSKRFDPLLISLSIFVIIGLVYVLIGFPTFLSKVTLFSMSPDYRALPIIGAGNCFLFICYLGSKNTELSKEKFSWVEFGVLAVAIFIFTRVVCANINKATTDFFSAEEVNMVSALVTIAYLLIRYKNFPFVKPVLYILLLGMTIHNAAANPVTKGLSPILENPLVKVSKEIYKKDPKPRWALFGNGRIANILKANGINILNCVKFVPPIKDMRVLDPSGRYDSAYNRYAWITMSMYIDGKDSVIFRQQYNDGYTIFVDPCSPRLKQLNIKYIVFSYKPQDAEIRCMTKVGEIPGIFIYKRNDQ